MDINKPYFFNGAHNPRNYLVIDQDQARPQNKVEQSNEDDGTNKQAQNPNASVNATTHTAQSSYTVTEAYKTLAEERAQSRSNRVSQTYTEVSHGNPGPNLIDTYA